MIDIESLETRQLLSSGSLAPILGADTPVAPRDAAYVVPYRTLVQSDGRVIVAGLHKDDWALRRYLPDGSVDTGFGDAGFFKIGAMLKSSDDIDLLAEAADGGLFIGGRAKLHDETFKGDRKDTVLIAKLTSGGQIDGSFLEDDTSNVGQAGFFRVSARRDFRANFVSALRSGKLLVATGNNHQEIALRRYDANGRLDRSFGNSGRISNLSVPIPTSPIEPADKLPMSYRSSTGLIVLAGAPDGTIVGLGYYVYARGSDAWGSTGSYTQASLPYFVRFGARGEVLATKVHMLDINKAQTSRYTGLSINGVRGMKVGPDGKIYVLSQQAVTRFNSDFSLDTSWSGDGIAAPTVAIDGREHAVSFTDIEFAPDGKVLGIAGAVFGGASQGEEPIVVRMNADGTMEAAAPHSTTLAGSTHRVVDAVEPGESAAEMASGEIRIHGAFRDDPPAARFDTGDSAALEAGPASPISNGWREVSSGSDRSSQSEIVGMLTPAGGKFGTHLASGMTAIDDDILMADAAASRGGVAWTLAARDGDVVRLLSHRISDVTAALAAARTLGSFAVRVPEPILTTASAAVSMCRERQRLAPNT